MIKPRNISTSNELNEVLSDINLTIIKSENRFWIDKNRQNAEDFIDKFVSTFNIIADRQEIDSLPVNIEI